MAQRFSLKKQWRRIRRSYKKRPMLYVLGTLSLLVLVGYAIMQSQTVINRAAYTPLLNVIAEGESRGNYNAYFGNATNHKIRFTEMTVAEVLTWQERYVADGNPSSAVGRYQFIQPTLEGLIAELDIPPQEVFDPSLQDSLAIALIERRGAVDFVKGKITAEQFAHNLSQEWAALPRVIGDSPEASYYAGDGLNHSRISIDKIMRAVREFKMTA